MGGADGKGRGTVAAVSDAAIITIVGLVSFNVLVGLALWLMLRGPRR